MERKDWITPKNGAVTAGTNGRVKGKRRTTTIRIAMQPPKQVASVRGVSVLNTVASRLLLALQKLINRPADQPGNRKVLSNRDFLKFRKLLGLQSY
jgi:hypothetical protein